jgi:hypothetical protein
MPQLIPFNTACSRLCSFLRGAVGGIGLKGREIHAPGMTLAGKRNSQKNPRRGEASIRATTVQSS